MNEPSDDRPALVLAMEWASRITTISLEMVVPALGGYWLDATWGTRPWLTMVGAALGPAIGFWHLIRLTSSPPTSSAGKKKGSAAQKQRPPEGGDATQEGPTKQ